VQYVDQTGFARGIRKLMTAAVFSSTRAGSDACWQTDAAGKFRQREMSGEDWAA